MHRFRALHPYVDLRKFLMNVHYQFQNGLIITKSSLRRTRFNDERVMRQLDAELMAKAKRPPIRLHISLKAKSAAGQTVQVPVQEPAPAATRPLVQITKRRKTVNPDELLRSSRQEQQPLQQQQQQPQPLHQQQQPLHQQQQPLQQSPKTPRTRIITPLANRITINNVTSPPNSAGAPAPAPAAPPAAVNMLRIVKRRNSYVVRTGP